MGFEQHRKVPELDTYGLCRRKGWWYSTNHYRDVHGELPHIPVHWPLNATLMPHTGTKNYIGAGVKVVAHLSHMTHTVILQVTFRVYAPNDVAVTYKTYTEALHKGTAWGGAPSTIDAYNTTFFKIREVALTYRLPQELCSRLGINGVSVSAIGQNVFLWAKQFKYSDPDGGSENFIDPQ